MHAMFFTTKRAFHAMLRIVRKPLRDHGMTSARFDLLSIIDGYPCKAVRQSVLWKQLGVSPATVSRMVGSLEAIGYVRTERAWSDRRQRIVSLTTLGLARMRAAVECFIQGRVGQRILDRAFRRFRKRGQKRSHAFFTKMCDYDDLLASIRQTCGDTASRQLNYVWHPDD